MTKAIQPGEWVEQALCAQVDVGDIFFPDAGQSVQQAKAICRRCNVQTECLTEAINNNEMYGIFGGLSVKERQRLKRQQAAA